MRLHILFGVLTFMLFTSVARAGMVNIPGADLASLNVKTMSMKERQYRYTSRQKLDYSCGSAALSTLLTYHYHDPVKEDVVYKAMWDAGDHAKIRKEGFSLLDMKRYLASRGYASDGYYASLGKLASVGIPAIVLLHDGGYNHFVVVKGIRDDMVAYGDPSLGARTMALPAFEKMMANHIVFVINGHKDEVVFNDPKDWRVHEKAPIASNTGPSDMTNVTFLRRAPGDF